MDSQTRQLIKQVLQISVEALTKIEKSLETESLPKRRKVVQFPRKSQEEMAPAILVAMFRMNQPVTIREVSEAVELRPFKFDHSPRFNGLRNRIYQLVADGHLERAGREGRSELYCLSDSGMDKAGRLAV
jgi:proline racemase